MLPVISELPGQVQGAGGRRAPVVLPEMGRRLPGGRQHLPARRRDAPAQQVRGVGLRQLPSGRGILLHAGEAVLVVSYCLPAQCPTSPLRGLMIKLQIHFPLPAASLLGSTSGSAGR